MTLQRPDLALFGCYVSSFGHVKGTWKNYDGAVDKFAKFLSSRFDIDLFSHKLPFLQRHLWFYFSFSGSYRNNAKGILRKSMDNDIYAFKRYHIDHGSILPLIRYRALDDLLDGYKTFQKHRITVKKTYITFRQVETILTYLINSGTFIDLVWALAFAMAWSKALRTGEWALTTAKHIQCEATLYFSDIIRNFPNISTFELHIKTMKNWRLGV